MSELKLIAGTSFSRGLSQAATHSLNDEEAQTAENYVFKDRTPVVRKGTAVHASLPYPVAALKKFYKNDGGNYFLAWAGGNFYYSTTSGEFTNLSMASVSGDIDTAAIGNTVYFCDNSGPLKYFNGDEVGNAGISAPIYLRTLADCENINDWTKNANGDLTTDNNYLHVQRGKKSIAFTASSPANPAVFQFGGGAGTEIETHFDDYENGSLGKTAITRNSSGSIFIAMTDFPTAGQFGKKCYFSNNSGYSFSGRILCSGPNTANYTPAIATDYSGRVHYVYNDTSGSFYHQIYDGGLWGTSSLITSGTLSINKPVLACDASNNLHLVYEKRNTATRYSVEHISFSGDAWRNVNVVASSTSGYYYSPHVAVDISNIVNVVFTGYTLSSPTYEIFHAAFIAGAWGNFSGISNMSGYQQAEPNIISNHSGILNVAWYGKSATNVSYNQIQYRQYTTQWTTRQELTSGTYDAYNPKTVSDESGSVYVFYYGKSATNPSYDNIQYRTFNLATSSWSNSVLFDNIANNENQIAFINSLYPRDSTSSRINYPRRGYAFIYVKFTSGGRGPYYFYAPSMLDWNGYAQTTMTFDLTKFTANLSSTTNDNINLYVVPHIRSSISSMLLKLTDYSGLTARKELHKMSGWVATSNDEFALQLEIPKVTMSTDTGFAWGSCNLSLELTPVSSNPQKVAQVSVDNIYMTNCPPIPATTVSTNPTTTTVVHDWVYFLNRSLQGYEVGLGELKTFDAFKVPGWARMAYWIQQSQNERRALEQEKLSKTPIPDGTYYYKATFLQKGPDGQEIESNPSYQSSGIVIANPANAYYYVQLTDLPIPPDGCGIVGRRIYRRRHDEENYRAVHTIYDNTVNRFLDVYSDKTLGMGIVEDDRWPPPQAKYILKGSDQVMYYFNIKEDDDSFPSRIRWSKPYRPYYVPINNVTDVTPNDGTEGTGMFDFLGQIHLLKDRSTWTLTDGQLINRHSNIGCVAPKSVAPGRNEVFWLSEQGVIKYTMRFENISHSLEGGSTYRIQKILDAIPKDRVKDAVGTFFDGYYFLAVCSENGTSNDTVLCYDVDNDVWSVFPNIQVNCWESWNGSQEGYRLFYGNNSGLICEFLTGDYDISTNISSKIRTKEFGLSVPEQAPRKAYLFLENLASGTVKSATVNPYFDWVNNSDHNNTQSTSAVYDTLKFDMPQTDAANFYSFEIVSTGRHRLNRLDVYGTTKNLR